MNYAEMTDFEIRLLELFQEFKVELTVDMDHGYDGSTVTSFDFEYYVDNQPKALYLEVKEAEFIGINAQKLEEQIDDKVSKI